MTLASAGRSLTLLTVGFAFMIPALAVTMAEVEAYRRLSRDFNAMFGREDVPAPDEETATCVLSALEAQGGRDAVVELIGLMENARAGVQFDDPAIVQFNARYGSVYRAARQRCGA